MLSNKKICAISTVAITMESFIIASMRRLKEDGYDVTLVCSMDEDFIDRYSNEFRCINIQMERGNDLFGMVKSILLFYRLFAKEKFQIIQYATPNASLYAAIAAYISGARVRVYCQWGLRYVGFEGGKRNFYKYIEKFTCSLSTDIRPVSIKNMHFAIEDGLYKKDKAIVLGAGGTVGIDFKEFNIENKVELKKHLIQKYKTLENKIVFGFIGRVVTDKGFNELILAWRSLIAKYDNIALLIVGSVEQDLDPVQPELLEWALANSSIIFTGHVSGMNRYVSAMDVLVHPSYREGFSMVIQQAHAMGIPVITTNIPGPSEVIEPSFTGLLVPVKDFKALTDAMENLLNNMELRTAFGENGYQRARQLFDRNVMVDFILKDRNHLINK